MGDRGYRKEIIHREGRANMRSRHRFFEAVRNFLRVIAFICIFLSIGFVGGIERGGSIGLGVVCGLACMGVSVLCLLFAGDLI